MDVKVEMNIGGANATIKATIVETSDLDKLHETIVALNQTGDPVWISLEM